MRACRVAELFYSLIAPQSFDLAEYARIFGARVRVAPVAGHPLGVWCIERSRRKQGFAPWLPLAEMAP